MTISKFDVFDLELPVNLFLRYTLFPNIFLRKEHLFLLLKNTHFLMVAYVFYPISVRIVF